MSEIPDTFPLAEGERIQIEELVRKIEPHLLLELNQLPEGFQYDVCAPYVRVSSKEEYRDVMGHDIDPVGAGLIGTGKLEASARLGVLNVTRGENNSLELEYRSQTGGKNFQVSLRDARVVVNSDASVNEVFGGLSLMFNETGDVNSNDRGFHSTTRRNLEFFDRDGNPKERSTLDNNFPLLRT